MASVRFDVSYYKVLKNAATLFDSDVVGTSGRVGRITPDDSMVFSGFDWIAISQ